MGVSLNPSTILSGQGIDVSSVVNQIISEQSGQLTVWEGQQTTFATQDGLLEGEENNLTNLQTAVADLADPTGPLTAQAATSSNPGVRDRGRSKLRHRRNPPDRSDQPGDNGNPLY